MSEKLKQSLAARRAIDRQVEETLRADYPIGKHVRWLRHGRVQSGCVIMHCSGDRLRVENSLTGKRPFIRAYDIVQAMRATP